MENFGRATILMEKTDIESSGIMEQGPTAAGSDIENSEVSGNTTTTKEKKAGEANEKKEKKEKAKVTVSVSKKRTRKVAEKEMKTDETSEDENSPTVLRKKLRFYKEKADMTEDRLFEKSRKLEEEKAKKNAELKRKKEEVKKLEEELKNAKAVNKGKKKEEVKTESSAADEDSSDPQSSSEDSEPPRHTRKVKRIPKIEITAADRRAARVCAYDPCSKLPDCTFVHISTGMNLRINDLVNKEIVYSGDEESEGCQEPLKKGKQCPERAGRHRLGKAGRKSSSGKDEVKKIGGGDESDLFENFIYTEYKEYNNSNPEPYFNCCDLEIGDQCSNSCDSCSR